MKTRRLIALCCVVVMTVSCTISACSSASGSVASKAQEESEKNASTQETSKEEKKSDASQISLEGIFSLPRPTLLDFGTQATDALSYTAQVPTIEVAPDLSNLVNGFNLDYASDELIDFLVEHHFVVQSMSASSEFYDIYEFNRYFGTIANFVTVDSMMHTYHLYFAYLQKTVEKEYLVARIKSLSMKLMETSLTQMNALKGTEWQDAARLNATFFAVGNQLVDPSYSIPAEVAEIAAQETALVMGAQGVETSPMTKTYASGDTDALEDYSQYKPRGYYAGDEMLERYFRAMMWYGRRNFAQRDETLDRAALLMTLAMNESGMEDWDALYAVTSFFVGTSDDAGYYEYLPLIEAAYDGLLAAADVANNDDAWAAFHAMTAELPSPAINDVPTIDDDEGEEDTRDTEKGFRFMGQRFSYDAAIMQELIYSAVKENAAGEARMLPSALDVPAALGSDTALEILDDMGATAFQEYTEHMAQMREQIAETGEEAWAVSLAASWLNTLRPLLTEKGEGYPLFMQSKMWAKKTLEGFLGSWTELKHDTILYQKQVVAEMGGGEPPEYDPRGYVEPEPEVFTRLAALTAKTASGLEGYGMLAQNDKTNLERLQFLAESFATMSVKELQNEPLSDDEYDLIYGYGGELEHFWYDAVYKEVEDEGYDPRDFPAALIADVATDPNGSVLEVANGNPQRIYVIVPIDGEPHLTQGAVYSFYEFAWALNDRMTDQEWRFMIGAGPDENGNYNWGDNAVEAPDKPAWTLEYRRQQYVY